MERDSSAPKPFSLYLPPVRKDDTRRQARRLAQGLTLSCTRAESSRVHPGALRNLAVSVRDISAGGLRFVASEPLKASSSVNLHLRQDATGVGLHARGEIAWTRTQRVEGREEHVVGVRFDEVLAPPETQARFFDGKPAEPPLRNRAGSRFQLSDFEVTLERDHRFRGRESAGNLALGLLDVSRSGARIVCTEPLKRGDRVRLTINLKNFRDIFTAEAETVWARQDSSTWNVGLSFGALSPAQDRKLKSMESWFSPRKPQS